MRVINNDSEFPCIWTLFEPKTLLTDVTIIVCDESVSVGQGDVDLVMSFLITAYVLSIRLWPYYELLYTDTP